jgi:hypothetical protein
MKILGRNGVFTSLFFLVIILLSSCASHKTVSKISVEPKFKSDDLIREKIAVFPVLIGEGSRFVPRIGNFAQTAGVEIISALTDWNSNLLLMGPNQINLALEENGLVESFSNLQQQFRTTGVLDISLIKEIVKPINAQYYIFTSIDSLVGTESIAYKPQVNAEMSARLYESNTSQIIRSVDVREEEVIAEVAESLPYESATIKASHSLINALVSDSDVKTKIDYNYALGYMGGFNYAGVHTDDPFFDPYTEKSVLLMGLGQWRLKGPFYLQTQIHYLNRKIKFKPYRTSAENIEWSYDFIDIPILFVFKPRQKLTIISQYVQVGSSICFNWNHSTTTSFGSGDVFSSKENRIEPLLDFALVLGTGYEFDVKEKLKFYTGVQYFRSFFSLHKYDTWKLRTYKIMAGFVHEF